MKIMSNIQNLGRTLMLPIAVLPVAGLLLRFGQPDMLDIPFVAAAGAAIFSNLGLLFAVGIAVGFARANHGAAALAGVVCYLVTTNGAQTLMSVPPDMFAAFNENARALAENAFRESAINKLSVPIGILAGIISGYLYNRYANIRLPEFLAFFGGKRFVPIAAGVAGIGLAALFGFGLTHIETGMDLFSRAVVEAGDAGLFIYGVLNRILIVTGLHHILNNVAWFILGDYQGVTGDLNRFFAGDPNAGAFMSGYFPVMMFGLPAACYAMYHAAPPERRKAVGGMYFSLALTSFLTGVTEPIEFTFMFLAPVLYAVHAVLTGIAMVIMSLLDVKMGFGFSAGFIDYILNFNVSRHPLLLLPIGFLYAILYYGMFRFFISYFNLKTPGRDDEIANKPAVATGASGDHEKALGFIAALGGPENLTAVDACTTRLRLTVQDQGKIDEAALKNLGARGVIRPSSTTLQVVLGPIADQTADLIKVALGDMKAPLSAQPGLTGIDQQSPPAIPKAARVLRDETIEAFFDALGGKNNILDIKAMSSRMLFKLKDSAVADIKKLQDLGARGVAIPGQDSLHLLLGPAAVSDGQAMIDMAFGNSRAS